MANIVVLQHSDKGRPGRMGRVLRDHGFHLDMRRPDRGDAVPVDLDNVHGLLILGGPQNVDEPHAWMKQEKDLIVRAHQAELPIVGICLGCQLIAEALGGEVKPMARAEQGFCPVSVTIPGQTETMLAGIPWKHHQFQSHAYEVSKLPADATLLMTSDAAKVQAFRAGLRTIAFQFHFEADGPMIEALNSDEAFNQKAGITRQELDAQVAQHEERFTVIADRLAGNVVTYAFPATTLLRV